MEANRLFTVGHSNRTLDEFLSLLKENDISAVVDVRSSPHSGRNPHFNRQALSKSLQEHDIEYVFMGDELGARRNEAQCYVDGVARYDRIAQTPMFKKGLDRLRRGMETFRIAMLCSEKDPITCHRTILICRHLKSQISIKHIIATGLVEEHADTELRLLKELGLSLDDLFQTKEEQVAYAYELQGEKIAYSENVPVTPGKSGIGMSSE